MDKNKNEKGKTRGTPGGAREELLSSQTRKKDRKSNYEEELQPVLDSQVKQT
jgi:hypothetical protein